MYTLFNAYGQDEVAVCSAYAEEGRDAKVARENNDYSIPARSYAKALWPDAILKVWLA